VIRFRTFSKAHGMAGARIGYAIAHADLIRSFEKIRNHFGVNRIAQAGALAALQDQAWLEAWSPKSRTSRDRISASPVRQWPHTAAQRRKFRHHRLRRGWRFCQARC
jgi:histidinol-phosphate/aromatic aminotransferase/cobyric acid decarboxylase-like protein